MPLELQVGEMEQNGFCDYFGVNQPSLLAYFHKKSLLKVKVRIFLIQ